MKNTIHSRVALSAFLLFLAPAFPSHAQEATPSPAPAPLTLPATHGETVSSWNGYEQLKFVVDGRACILVVPKSPLPGNPWIWRPEFFGAFPQADIALLGKGVYVDILSVCGGADTTVPLEENTAIVEDRYKKLGGHITVIVKPGADHHPHSLTDPTPIVDFVLAHCK